MDEYVVVQDTLGDGADEWFVAARRESTGSPVYFDVVASAISLSQAQTIATALSANAA